MKQVNKRLFCSYSDQSVTIQIAHKMIQKYLPDLFCQVF